MAKGSKLAPEEVEELFSKIDASGVVRSKRSEPAVDPLSDEDPSGSKVASSISRMGIAFIAGIIIFVVGMQVGYGVMRRLNTANLSDTVTTETVSRALEGGVEWGNGFTQFPADFTNALLTDTINRVVYNVSAYVDEGGNIVAGNGEDREARLVFTFIWTKNKSEASSNIDWELRIVGMDEEIAGRIQTQVNSVSSLIETPSVDDADIDAHERELLSAQEQKGEELYLGDDGGATLDAARERVQEDASTSH